MQMKYLNTHGRVCGRKPGIRIRQPTPAKLPAFRIRSCRVTSRIRHQQRRQPNRMKTGKESIRQDQNGTHQTALASGTQHPDRVETRRSKQPDRAHGCLPFGSRQHRPGLPSPRMPGASGMNQHSGDRAGASRPPIRGQHPAHPEI
jgi:hypothetical protein